MPRGRYAVQKARKEHRCSQAWSCYIKPGQFYLYMAAPPEHETYRGSGRWWVVKACLKHAKLWQLHTDATRAQVAALGVSDG